MKKIFNYIGLSGVIAFTMTACHKVDVPVTTQLIPELFPTNSAQFIQAAGPAYMALRGGYSLEYHFMQSLSTDEGIMPARGGNWYDNRNYIDLHYHTWTKDHPLSNSTWVYLSKIVSSSNQAMSILGPVMSEGSDKNSAFAELKMVRAIAYYMFMDLFGNVPIDTVYGDFALRDKMPRADVFKFIESEVKGSLPFLSNVVGQVTYGRPNKYTAFALLAKMYLNAETYTGTPRWNDCIAYCDSVISSGKYTLEPMSSYLNMFYPTNGPTTREFIFAIPYDPAAGTALGLNGYMYHARYDVPRSETSKFGLSFTPSAPRSTLPEFYANFNDANDVRNKQWLTGKQYLNDGVTPVMVKTTKKGYDQFYSGSDGAAEITYQVELTPNVVLRQSVPLVDCGNDEIAWNMGYRNIKFYPDASSTSRNQNNDVPMFRYSDIILMKAEAILRGGTATLSQTPLSLVNSLRNVRTTSAALASVDLDFIYQERCREFAWESWHRNDMIRFGKYEGSWGFKTNSETYRRIFPIPTAALTLNPALTPNTGY
jgi:starch-binding outer membrane protein, SusD/RagB family